MFKRVILICILALIQFASVNATEDFTTTHNVTYRLGNLGETDVTHNISIDVKNSLNGVKTITFTEPVESIENIEKLDKNNYTISTLANQVQLNFTKAIVGPKTVDISYGYKTDQIFKKSGTIYTLDLASIEQNNSLSNFSLKIYLPLNLSIYSDQFEVITDNTGKYINLTQDDLKKGENIIFGNKMLYGLNINYVVNKDKNYIVIPPNIENRQKVYIKQIDKRPNKAYIDEDGNNIFVYNIKDPQQIRAQFYIEVYGNPSTVKIDDKEKYLKPVENWDYTKGIPANYLKFTQSISTKEDVKNAVEFNNEYLEYDLNKSNYDYIARIGAENLNESNKSNAVCLEYSDLLIAQLRGLQIPARELSGLSYSKDIKDFSFPFLHSWVDYYNGKEWVMVDPTYNDTANQDFVNSFDLFHIVFLMRATDSESPLLPGSFKTDKFSEKLMVEAIESFEPVVINIEAFRFLNYYIIKNNSNSFIIKTAPASIGIYTKDQIESLSSDKNISIEFSKLNIFTAVDKTVVIILIFLLFSPALFIITHKTITKRKHKVKSKVNSIV